MSDKLARPARSAGNKLRQTGSDIVDLWDLTWGQLEPPNDDAIGERTIDIALVKYLGLLATLVSVTSLAAHYYHTWLRPHADLAYAIKLATAISVVAFVCGVLVVRVAPRDKPLSIEWSIYSFIMVWVCASSFASPGGLLQVVHNVVASLFATLITPQVSQFWRDRRVLRAWQTAAYAATAWTLTMMALL
ncbi:MAG TPA: hypothetical protein VLF59_00330 [Candidatus Saccharimonadales bacterium]|nr:hypothetical protein [Candidatus Saccharimonadales bacterium]